MKLSFERSNQFYAEAKQLFPGGVNSPVRSFNGVGGDPIFVDRASAAYFWDADGNRFIDYIGSWGTAIVGHAHPEVVDAVKDALGRGFSFGIPTELENRLAKLVQSMMPNMEMMRFVSSGTEACMSALRLARGFTGRDKILKFDGCYHGHGDMLLVQAGSGVATLGIPGSPGVPKGATQDTLVSPFNDLTAVEEIFAQHGSDIAAIILEPIMGNANFIRPLPGFLEGLRKLCDDYGTVLIFDEVMTGFRVGFGGVQGLSGVHPDLTTFGKVIGGGMPIGAYGGRKDIMSRVAPSGPVYQAGTLSGNPIAVTCGIKTLELLKNKYDFTALAERTNRLASGLKEAATEAGIPLVVDHEGGMFGFAFHTKSLRDFTDAKAADIQSFHKFFHAMLQRGVYLAPSAFEAGFVSLVHSDEDIEETLNHAKAVFSELRKTP
ncbi:MAG: glutamate-1-semialdehyde 2,1-aminomutase [Oligoflexus sp.]